MWRMKKETVEEIGIIGGLVLVQCIYAGNSVLISYVMSLGVDPLTIVIFSTFATFFILSPIALIFERKQWPSSLSLKLMVKLILIAFAGVAVFQTLYLQGIKMTSPAVATAMPNLSPGLIFFIAWTFRLEKVKLSCVYSRVKIVGTLVCVVGAITMSLMHNSASASELKDPNPNQELPPNYFSFDSQKLFGCLCLFSAVFVLSVNVVLQASALVEFPAPISLCAVTSLLGAFMTLAVQIFQDHKVELSWPSISFGTLIAISMLGGILNGACFSFCGWAIRKRGPVTVSLFSPIATVVSMFLSVLTLGDQINLGSILGMFLMFGGLYSVLWAKGKEDNGDGDGYEELCDEEKPLLV